MTQLIKRFFQNETLSYLFFGCATTAVNWISYTFFVSVLHLGVTPSNIAAWCISVAFAYVTNKLFVFKSKDTNATSIFKELSLFVSSRLVSGAIEILGVPFLIGIGLNQSIFNIEGMLAKVSISVIVVIANYIFSKLIVFKKRSNKNA